MTDSHAKQIYNKVAFIATSLLPMMDELLETTQPKHAAKYHLKSYIKESEAIIYQHAKSYENHGEIEQPDGTAIHSRDIHNVTSKAYDYLLSKDPHEICSIVELVKAYEAGGVDYQDFDIEYRKLK